MITVACVGEVSGDAAEGEFTRAVAVEEDVGGLHHVGIVLDIVGHCHDPPASDEAHVGANSGAASSLGRRTRL